MNRLAIAGSLAALGIVLGVACSDNPAQPDATATPTSQAAQNGRPTTTTNTPRTATPNGSLMTTAELVKYAEPSVVRIENTTSVGSGFIVGEDGYIITNNHVVAGPFGRPVSSVQVTLSDGSEYEARIVGTDPKSDLALLKIDATGLQPLSLAKLDDVQIGDDVVAIGYALDLKAGEGPSFTVTRGIVSQKNRAISEDSSILGAVQTDAAINHGNSGGPLLNLKGEVVGVNTALQPDQTTGQAAQGIGYAVGSDTVAAVYEQLKANGRVDRGLLGVQWFEALRPAKARELGIPEDEGGVYLPTQEELQSNQVLQAGPSVVPGGPADQAGIRPGDVITRIGDDDIKNEGDLAVAMIGHAPGTKMDVEIYRDGKKQTVTVTVGTP